MNRLLLSFFALLLLTFASCKRDVSYNGGPDPQPNIVNPEPITATLQGNVYNENNQPVLGAVVKVGIKTATTDAKGFFRMLNAPLDKNAAMITVEQPGYFKGVRTISATSGTNNITIKLLKRTLSGTVNSTAGGEVSLSNGTKINLPANGVVLQNNTAYTGTINVYATYIDPTSNELSQTIPGSLMADDKNGSRVTMASYGMVAVELTTTSGAKLQLKAGSKAKLTVPIPASISATAPATIPLWYLDEDTTGIWQEQGTATKTGNSYVGEVAHFSFWNCDISLPAVQLTVKLNNGTQPLVHALVKITSATYFGARYGYTDSLGVVSGLVPANQPLTLQVVDQCYNAFYTQSVNPLSQNTILPAITIAPGSTGASVITVQGSLQNCQGNAVTNGYALISHGNNSRYVSVDASGNFTTTFVQCPGTSPQNMMVLGVDNTTAQQGTASTVSVTTPVTNAGNISACGTSALQFINFTYDGVQHSITSNFTNDSTGGQTYTNPTTGYNTNLTGIASSPTFKAVFLNFTHATANTGTPYPVNSYIGVYLNGVNHSYQGMTNVNITFTNFPSALGQFYEGSFSGTFQAAGAVHTINGTFKLRRNN